MYNFSLFYLDESDCSDNVQHRVSMTGKRASVCTAASRSPGFQWQLFIHISPERKLHFSGHTTSRILAVTNAVEKHTVTVLATAT